MFDVIVVFFQMEGGILSQLMKLDAGAQKFVADCFLLLDPKDLKACRLVSTTWSKFIKKEVWENPSGRKKLNEKLVQLWKTADPVPKELGQREWMFAMMCDDRYIYNAVSDGRVEVNKLSDGVKVTDLTPDGVIADFDFVSPILAGSDGLVFWHHLPCVGRQIQ